MRLHAIALWALLLATSAQATVVRFEPATAQVAAGSSFQVELVAQLDEPVLGFGLDLDLRGVALEGPPLIGPAWLPVEAADGDGLAGVAFPDGVAGDRVLLATLPLVAGEPGVARLFTGFTVGDLTEGFALDPSGFASPVGFESAEIRIVPEPGGALLCGAALTGLALSRRRWTRAAR